MGVANLAKGTTQADYTAKAMLFKYAGDVQRPNPFKQGTPKKPRSPHKRLRGNTVSHRP